MADELKQVMEARGHLVNVHHIDEVRPKELPPADLYVFGSPTRFGGPIGGMKRFLKKAALPAGTKYALFATHGEEQPDKKTGKPPSEVEIERLRRTLPIMEESLKEKGMVKVADKFFLVTATEMRGTLLEGWQGRVSELADAILGTTA